MTVGATLFRDAPHRLWTWWVSELASVARRIAPRKIGIGAPELIVSPSDDGSWLATTARATLHGTQTPFPLRDNSDLRRPKSVRLRLAQSDCFIRNVDMPSAARRDMARLLALDLERATPFKPSDVYAAFAVDSHQPRSDFVSVQHVVAQRHHIDAMLADLTARGYRTTQIDCASEPPGSALPVNLLTAVANADGRSASSKTSLAVLFVASVALLASAAGIAISRQDAALDDLVRKTTEARAVSQARRAAQQTADAISAQANAVVALTNARPSMVALLNELARVLPDTAWLTDIKIDHETVDISGYAKPAASLVATVEQSSIFSDAELTSAVTRDDARDRERFNLRARITPAQTVDASKTHSLDINPGRALPSVVTP